MAVVEVVGARKEYRRWQRPPALALAGLDLTVAEHGVHGFLGPNGSGKTTTIRALLGLIRLDAGSMRLLGHDVPAGLPAAIGGVGALVETPLFFPTFSGRRNLRLLAGVAGLPDSRVEECLELVDLRDRADDLVRGYSLGMKQRLGIAAALLKAPRLLVLDEPSNGLDPAGIREVRELIRRLGADGATTVLLSSHLLTEVEQVCDDVTIVAGGRLVAHGRVSEVLAAASSGDLRLRVAPADHGAVSRLLAESGWTAVPDGPGWRVNGVPDPGELTRRLAEGGCYLTELTPVSADLESAFLSLVAADHGSDAGVAGGPS